MLVITVLISVCWYTSPDVALTSNGREQELLGHHLLDCQPKQRIYLNDVVPAFLDELCHVSATKTRHFGAVKEWNTCHYAKQGKRYVCTTSSAHLFASRLTTPRTSFSTGEAASRNIFGAYLMALTQEALPWLSGVLQLKKL